MVNALKFYNSSSLKSTTSLGERLKEMVKIIVDQSPMLKTFKKQHKNSHVSELVIISCTVNALRRHNHLSL